MIPVRPPQGELKAAMEMVNNTLQFDLAPEDIANPRSERVQLFCRAFLMYVFDIPESVLLHLPHDPLTTADEHEELQRATPLIMVFSCMRQFISDMNPDIGFGMCDLITPNDQRFRRLLMFIADYLKFHSTMMPHWENTCSKYDEQRNQLKYLEEAKQDAEKKLNTLTIDQDARKRRENELSMVLGKKQAELQEHYKTMKDIESAMTENEKIIEQEKFLQNELALEKENLQMQLDQLSLQIVSSPERVLRELEQYKEELAHVRASCDKQRKANEDTKDQLAMSAKVSQLIDKFGIDVQSRILTEKALLDQKNQDRIDVEQQKRETEVALKNKKSLLAEDVGYEEKVTQNKQAQAEWLAELEKRKEVLELEVIELRKQFSSNAEERKFQEEIAKISDKTNEVQNAYRMSVERTANNYKTLIESYKQQEKAFMEENSYYSDILKKLQIEAETNFDLNVTANQTLDLP